MLNHPRINGSLTLTWIALVVLGSLQPFRPPIIATLALHRAIHWLAFAGAAFPLLLLAPNGRQELRSGVAVCLLGLSLEHIQHLFITPLWSGLM
jgi:hypothetical protein